jgi:hypothetical protein
MEQQCSDIKKNADRAGDEHYRAMTQWVTGGRTRKLLNRAYPLALRYRRQLGWLVECYQHARSSILSRSKVKAADDYKTLIEQDIKILESYDPIAIGDSK